ncbi:MAG TPA: zinc-binding dehydrogenase [Nocardioides sp.]|jgi:2-desacetyl-2-hydroxyethyl bacteriochlorophyllide A dehydrogenase|uniref:zinc-binding dehydrogenase n=1 Tax=Nocardioides sp. TaxID=35761 RepID=UPI002E322254|nr:zinc-binding dehydrogenase [Nocardioides sp.]HEX3931182.1 zinc-binding dehydrogenase [Nocardioides sp.]
MRQGVLTGPGSFDVVDVATPVPGRGEVLVEVSACGVCASELEAWTGRSEPTYPLRLGHEVSGTVVEVGPGVESPAVGEPVGVWVASDGYADFVVARAEHCFAAQGAPLDTVLAEPLACAVNAVELADVRLGDDVVLVGAGFMGHLVHQLVALRGARQVIVADTRVDALERAVALGATATVHAGDRDLAAAVAELTDGVLADVSFECTGSQAALESMGRVTRMSGKLVLVGFHQGPPRSVPLGWWNWMAYDVRNAHFREMSTILRGMDVGMRLLRAGLLDLAPHVTHRFPLADIGDAFDAAVTKPDGFVKAVVTMAGTS